MRSIFLHSIQRHLSILLAIFALSACHTLRADTDFGLVGRQMSILLQNNHYNSPPLDDALSQIILTDYLDFLDPQHNYFTGEDVATLTEKYGTEFDDLLLRGESMGAALEIYQLFQKRVAERLAQTKELLDANDFDFTIDESVKRDRSEAERPANDAAARENWRRVVKADLVTELVTRDQIKRRADEADKPQLAEFDRTPVEKVALRYERLDHSVNDVDNEDIAAYFLQVVAAVHDPHTSYLSSRSMDRFRSAMANSLVGIGAQLSAEEDGATKITGIIVGGPADQAGELQLNDRILAVDPDYDEDAPDFVDTILMPLDKVVDLIRGEEGTKVALSIEPAEGLAGEVETIVIVRGKVELKDEFASAQLIVMKGDGVAEEQRIGVITLPSFYGPLDQANQRCSSDVRKLLERLMRENIDGLVIDLRGNGGGYFDEVRQMVGFFCDRGPVVQVQEKPRRVEILESDLRRAIYRGPLVILTDKSSASASEILAAALQDNNRAVIVGDSSTFGKGTVQKHMNISDFMPVMAETERAGFVKLTIQKFYRVTGQSTQKEGVVPDVTLPSISDAVEFGEAFQPHVMAQDETTPAPRYSPLDRSALFIDRLSENSAARIEASQHFTYLKEDIERIRQRDEENSVSLQLEARIDQIETDRAREKDRNKDRAELFAKIAEQDEERMTIYRLNLDDVASDTLPEVNLKQDAEDYIRKAKRERAELYESPEWPNGLDGVKREGLAITRDLIKITRTAKLAGALPN